MMQTNFKGKDMKKNQVYPTPEYKHKNRTEFGVDIVITAKEFGEK